MRIILLLLLLTIAGCGKRDFTGTFSSINDGLETIMTLNNDDGVISGRCSEGNIYFNITGKADGDAMSGTFNEKESGLPVMDFNGSFSDANTLELTLSTVGNKQTLVFQRKETSAKQSATSSKQNATSSSDIPSSSGEKSVDPEVVGRWTNEKITNDSNGSMTKVNQFIFDDNGSYKIYSASFGFTGQFKFGSEQMELIEEGEWYTTSDGMIHYKGNGYKDFGSFSYKFHNGNLVTNNDVIWTRE